MSAQNHCTIEFKGRVFSNRRTRKISFTTSTKFDAGDVTACLKSFDNGKETVGYIKFNASPTDQDSQANLHLKNFLSAMQIVGFEFELITGPRLRWITPDGKTWQRIQKDWKMPYKIDVITISLSKNEISTVETVFCNLPVDIELQQLASDLAKNEKIPEATAELLFYWTGFNKIYGTLSGRNECKRIEKYIDRLSQQAITALYQKHSKLFTNLSKFRITSRQGYDLSNDLKQKLSSRNEKVIVKKAILCVYGLRNSFMHERHFFGFKKILDASIFTRDVIYATLFPKYGI